MIGDRLELTYENREAGTYLLVTNKRHFVSTYVLGSLDLQRKKIVKQS